MQDADEISPNDRLMMSCPAYSIAEKEKLGWASHVGMPSILIGKATAGILFTKYILALLHSPPLNLFALDPPGWK